MKFHQASSIKYVDCITSYSPSQFEKNTCNGVHALEALLLRERRAPNCAHCSPFICLRRKTTTTKWTPQWVNTYDPSSTHCHLDKRELFPVLWGLILLYYLPTSLNPWQTLNPMKQYYALIVVLQWGRIWSPNWWCTVYRIMESFY